MADSPLSDEQLAALPVAYGTAMGNALERGCIVEGETVVVTGASGGVGPALVQLAAARGAQVIAVTSGSKGADVLSAGAFAGPVVDFDLRRLYLHNISLIGSSMHTRAHFAALVDAARTGAVQPVIAARHPLNDLAAAQDQFRHGRHVGKIIIAIE